MGEIVGEKSPGVGDEAFRRKSSGSTRVLQPSEKGVTHAFPAFSLRVGSREIQLAHRWLRWNRDSVRSPMPVLMGQEVAHGLSAPHLSSGCTSRIFVACAKPTPLDELSSSKVHPTVRLERMVNEATNGASGGH